MKNFYSRLKWLVVILVTMLVFMVINPANASYDSIAFQQEVRGVVKDQAGMPLPGVTVSIKGENRGVVTDIDGNYFITVGPQDQLVFSFVGFKTMEEAVLGREEINIELKEDVSQLGEVQINAGYYNTTRRESTGNISRVTAEEIELQPVISPLQALQGRMAGVEIVPGGNQPGMASTIRIRGRNSLREEGNFPLYIIDGVPISSTPLESNSIMDITGIDPLNSLNLSNIESIEVLKDADATAIYGSRGANGVVLITTKRARSKKTGLEGRVYRGISQVPNRMDMLNTQQYLQIRKRAFENDGIEPTEANAYDLVLWDQNRDTDWQDFFFGGTSKITNVNLSTNGGNENTFFRLGGSYFKQGTVYPADLSYEKVTADLNIRHLSENKKLSIDLSANYGLDSNNLVGNVNLSYYAFFLPPNAPQIFNDDGSLHWENWVDIGGINPLTGFFNKSNTQSNNFITSLGISYQLFKGLNIKANAGYTNNLSEELVKYPKKSFNPSSWENINNRSSHRFIKRNSWIVEPQIIYNQLLGNGEIDALVGITFQENNFNNKGFTGNGYVSESVIGNLSAAENIEDGFGQSIKYRYTALFGRLGYNYERKYYINLTGRRDGSSRFGPGKKFGNFIAVGSAWIFSEESFLKKYSSFLSFGKLRGSYGLTGNDQIGDYGFLDAYEATPGPGGLYPTQLSNPNFSWEINKKLEAALELGFFEDRVGLGLSWYRNRSSNQLVGYQLPAITGFNTVQANLPATVENTGWEITMSSTNFQNEKFYWQTSFNLTIPRNELLKFPNIEQSSYSNTYRVGHPLNISLLYQYQGLDPESGFYTFADNNDDERLDFNDRSVIQDLGRKFYGGLNNNIRFQNFSFQLFWEFVQQKGSLSLFDAGVLSNQRADVLQGLEDNSPFQRISLSPQASLAYFNALQSNLSIVDASYVRLKTISLGYSIPLKVLQPLGIIEGKIFLNGQNLITLSDYKGIDPELPYGGTDFAGLRTITGGLQINF